MLTVIRDRVGNRLTITRSGGSTRRIERITSPNGRWVAFTYVSYPDTSVDLITQIEDNSGRTVSYEYVDDGQENFRITRVTDPAGGVTEYTYTPGQSVPQLMTSYMGRR